jgi:hypothetical protein
VSRIGRAVLGLMAAAVCVVAPAGGASAAVDTEGAACAVDYDAWEHSGGFNANVILMNTGKVIINGWTVYFPVEEVVEVIDIWEAELVSPTGRVTARNAPHNPVLEPGESLTIGFLASGTPQRHPETFVINGVECTVVELPALSAA